jgi:hypothetical protein
VLSPFRQMRATALAGSPPKEYTRMAWITRHLAAENRTQLLTRHPVGVGVGSGRVGNRDSAVPSTARRL